MADHVLSIVGAGALIWIVGCTLTTPLDDLEGGPAAPKGGSGGAATGGDGGRGGVSEGGAGGEDPGPGDECTGPIDCAPPSSRCIDATCNDGYCGYVSVGNLMPIDSQVEGDCQAIVCDGTGGELLINTLDDLPDDGNECTEDTCANGPENTVLMGSACNAGVCNGKGQCVECLTTGDCMGTDECLSELCVPPSCNDAFQNGDETALNCGGSCPPCNDGLTCSIGGDCISGVCNVTCQAPSCSDFVKNGLETGVDCGAGLCPLCGTGQDCDGPQNCISGVCTTGQCQAPTCDDSIRNGTETDVDCGGMVCPRCGPGRICDGDGDCSQNLRCVGGSCADPCSDGTKNFQETDVDCGGPLCASCNAGQECLEDRDCGSGNCCENLDPHQCGTKTLCPMSL